MSCRYLTIGPGPLGVSGVALSSSTNSNAMGVTGVDQVELELVITNATAAALSVTFNLEHSIDGTNYASMTTRSIAYGVETHSVRSVASPTTAASAATYRYNISIDDIKDGYLRLGAITAAGSGTGDLLSITAHLRVPA